ncbi:MAG: hypothetical protein ACRDLN_10815 [Solirubrobacteraceae bacterium]
MWKTPPTSKGSADPARPEAACRSRVVHLGSDEQRQEDVVARRERGRIVLGDGLDG